MVDVTTPISAKEEYYDLGSFGRSVSTTSDDAQAWFNRGLTWAYSFNHEEAVKCFEQVIAHDADCAMGYWGVAFATGPNYNKKWSLFDEQDLERSTTKAYNASRAGDLHLANAKPLEKALVKAIQHRFPAPKGITDFDGVNRAYADAMRDVYNQFDDDLDVVALFADSLMNMSPWGLYDDKTGKPILSTPVLEVKQVLDRALKLPGGIEHPGILHMYIHLMEMSSTPEVALVPADHLRNLCPDSGHLCHMPSHLDILLGNYREAIAANMKATIADDKYFKQHGDCNFYSLYRLHDYHSLIYAAMLAGQSKVALDATSRMEATISEKLLRMQSPPMAKWLEIFCAIRVHVLIRFGRWTDILDLPIPKDEKLYCSTVAMTYYGKGIANAVLGNIDQAEHYRQLYKDAAVKVPPDHMDFPNKVSDLFKVATAMLDGELEYRKGNYDVAFANLREAIKAEDSLLYTEPWSWFLPARHSYAALLLEQGHVEQATEVYAEDLGFGGDLTGAHTHPNNVWSLHGYHECLHRLGRTAEARLIERTLKVAIAVADVPITSSCFCRLSNSCHC